ncbi:hypothetical protein D3C72_2522550 [compost metagenome]
MTVRPKPCISRRVEKSGFPEVKIAGSSPFNGSKPSGSGTSERARRAMASAGSNQSTGQGASLRNRLARKG